MLFIDDLKSLLDYFSKTAHETHPIILREYQVFSISFKLFNGS